MTNDGCRNTEDPPELLEPERIRGSDVKVAIFGVNVRAMEQFRTINPSAEVALPVCGTAEQPHLPRDGRCRWCGAEL